MELIIKESSGNRFTLTIEGTSLSVAQVKVAIEASQSVEPARQRLIYKGRILDDERTLSDYNITAGSTLFLVKSRAPSAVKSKPAAPATTSASAAAVSSTNAAASGLAMTASSTAAPTAGMVRCTLFAKACGTVDNHLGVGTLDLFGGAGHDAYTRHIPLTLPPTARFDLNINA